MLSDPHYDEGFLPFREYHTWYCIYGNLHNHPPQLHPLVVLHGGAALPHDYLRSLAVLADTGRPVIFYDQLGCGRSDWPDDPTLWSLDLFVDELRYLLQALGITSYHLLGHSWGGIVALEYTLTQPIGIQSLILASSFADYLLYQRELARLHQTLPENVRTTIAEHERAGTRDHPAYHQARSYFEHHYICRAQPWPDVLSEAAQPNRMNYEVNWRVYHYLMEHQWNRTDQLHTITCPVLVTVGAHDVVTPIQIAPFTNTVKDAKIVTFQHSAHHPHLEETERYNHTINKFLHRVEGMKNIRPSAG